MNPKPMFTDVDKMRQKPVEPTVRDEDGDYVEGDYVITLAEFREACELGSFIDYDGHGYFSDGQVAFIPSYEEYWDGVVKPSKFLKLDLSTLDPRITHIVWANR